MLEAVGAFTPREGPELFDSAQADAGEPAQRRIVHASIYNGRYSVVRELSRFFPDWGSASGSRIVPLGGRTETAPGAGSLSPQPCASPALIFGAQSALKILTEVKKRMSKMKTLKLCLTLLPLIVAGMLVGCSQKPAKSPDVSGNIRQSLDQANLKDVSVSQDRDKGVVTLGGHVATEGDKSNAESIAKSIAVDQVVANQIAVLTPGAESDAKTVNSDLDKGIEHNLDAALIQAKLHKSVQLRRQSKCCHAEWGGCLSIRARPGPGGRVRGAKREAGGE